MLEIGPYCTAAVAKEPSILRTSYQTIDRVPVWNNQQVVLDDYLWLPVNLLTGEPIYQSLYSVPKYAPPLLGLNNATNADVVCFLGDSHARYLLYQAKMISYNATWQKDGCNDRRRHTGFIGPDVSRQFRYFKMEYYGRFLGEDIVHVTANFQSCNMIVILFGHWEAGTRKQPTVPAQFASGVRDVMERLQNVTPSSTRIYLASTDASPTNWRLLDCIDWRTPAMMDVYNTFFRKMTVAAPGGSSIEGQRKFMGLENSYYLDNNTDILDPVWDEAHDWNHPCRFSFRAMAYRVLLLMSRSIDFPRL